VVVFGGYGTFGRLVCVELAARGVALTVVGRDIQRAQALAHTLGPGHTALRADARDLDDCRRALSGARVSVVCAGPFSALGDAALTAALAEGCHHVDIADDRHYVASALTKGPAFAARGLSVVPGCSSLPALSIGLALSAAEGILAPPRRARVTLFIGNDNVKGQAATASALSGLGRPIRAPQGLLHGFREGERVVLPPPFGARRVYSIDAPDYDLLPAALGLDEVAVKVGLELRAAALFFAVLARVPGAHRLGRGFVARGGELLRGFGSSGGVVMAELFWPDGLRRARAIVARAHGQRMAALPAALVAEALLRSGPAGPWGAVQPDDVLGPGGLLAGMAAAGFPPIEA
jgi:hypothetical protein